MFYFHEDLIRIMTLLVCMDVHFPKTCLQMLSYKIFQMQYDFLYNHTSYLRGMIYLTNIILIKNIKLINQRKTISIFGRNNGRQTRKKLEAIL